MREYEAYQVKDYNTRVFEQTSAEKQRLWDVALQADAEYKSAQSSIPNEVHQELLDKERELEAKRQAALESRANQASDHQGANTYVHVILMAVAHYLLQLRFYAPQAYFAVATVFSVVLAIVLEAIIRVDLHVVTLSKDEMDKLVKAGEMSAEMNEMLHRLLRAFLIAAVSTLIFLFYCIGMKFEADINIVTYALVIFVLVNMVMMCVFPRHAEVSRRSVTPTKHAIDATAVYNEMVITVVKACSSFLGFLILGVIFGNSFQELTLTAVGMTIGSAGGQLIRPPERTAV